jgi:hypothetical protein
LIQAAIRQANIDRHAAHMQALGCNTMSFGMEHRIRLR